MSDQRNDPNVVGCIYCGGQGSRAFHAVSSRDPEYVDQWACNNRYACERRQERATHDPLGLCDSDHSDGGCNGTPTATCPTSSDESRTA